MACKLFADRLCLYELLVVLFEKDFDIRQVSFKKQLANELEELTQG